MTETGSAACQLGPFGDRQCPRTMPHKSAINHVQIGLARRRRLFIGSTYFDQTLNVIKYEDCNRKHLTCLKGIDMKNPT